jgi:hypothetical protein
MGKDDNLKKLLSINKSAELIPKVGELTVNPGEGWWNNLRITLAVLIVYTQINTA